MKLIYLKSALKCDSFDVAIDIKIQFFRVLVTIEPDRSLLQFVTTNCLIIASDTVSMPFAYTAWINLVTFDSLGCLFSPVHLHFSGRYLYIASFYGPVC